MNNVWVFDKCVCVGDLIRLDLSKTPKSSWAWESKAAMNYFRQEFGMVYYKERRQIFVFGGLNVHWTSSQTNNAVIER